jgi:hypothetical protein
VPSTVTPRSGSGFSPTFPEAAMQLAELLGLPVWDADARQVGNLIDLQLTITEKHDGTPSTPELFGLVISPHTHSSYLGYERSRVNSPRLLAGLLRWRHRGTYLTLWTDVASIDRDAVRLRSGYRRYSPVLPAN